MIEINNDDNKIADTVKDTRQEEQFQTFTIGKFLLDIDKKKRTEKLFIKDISDAVTFIPASEESRPMATVSVVADNIDDAFRQAKQIFDKVL